MKFWLILIFSLLVLMAGAKRPRTINGLGSIAGQLTDEIGEPIPGGTISLVDTLTGAATDISGHYCLTDIVPGIYDIRASTVGYTTVTAESLVVIADSIAIQNFRAVTQGIQIKDIVIKAQRRTVVHYPTCDNPPKVTQFGKVAGQVLDENGRSIPGCSIFLEGTNLGTITRGPGYYCLDYILPGIYNISAMTVGFNKLTAESLLVAEDSISIQDFQLTSDSLSSQIAPIRAKRNIVGSHPGCD